MTQDNLQHILQWNCRGLSNKVGELKTRMAYGKLKAWALLLQEHNKLCPIRGYVGYQCPTIPDQRSRADSNAPGKAAIYIKGTVPQAPIDLRQWCNQQQEVVAVITQPYKTPLILVAAYARPRNSTLNLGWVNHIRTSYPGIPIIVGGDFNAPHTEWGYDQDSKLGEQIRTRLTDLSFTLLNQPGSSTLPASGTHSPDLTWWMGPGMLDWTTELDTWGSDHTPILITIRKTQLKKIRKKIKITMWDKVRLDTRSKHFEPATLITNLHG